MPFALKRLLIRRLSERTCLTIKLRRAHLHPLADVRYSSYSAVPLPLSLLRSPLRGWGLSLRTGRAILRRQNNRLVNKSSCSIWNSLGSRWTAFLSLSQQPLPSKPTPRSLLGNSTHVLFFWFFTLRHHHYSWLFKVSSFPQHQTLQQTSILCSFWNRRSSWDKGSACPSLAAAKMLLQAAI